MVDGQNAYLKTQILTARPEQLTLMLFDGAIRFAEKGRAHLEQRDFNGSYESLSRAEQIVVELLGSLRPETAPDICRQQAGLYVFAYSKLVEANLSHDDAPLVDAIRVLKILRETWVMLMEKLQNATEPAASRPLAAIMGSTMSVKG